MKRLLTLSALLSLLGLLAAPAICKEDESGPSVTLTRRLVDFPVGSYVMVQSWDDRVRHVLEMPDEEPKEKKTRQWNRFTFDLEVVDLEDADGTHGSASKEARVRVRRVQVGIEGDRDLAYDSGGEPGQQAEPLLRQFRYMVGGQATLDLATFGEGGGFTGLTAVWDRFEKENPTSSGAAAANRKNFGDTRLDRMFARGLPVLFGKDADAPPDTRANSRSGASYEVALGILGIGRESADSKHTVMVESLADGHVKLDVTWAENGHNPKTDGGAIAHAGRRSQGASGDDLPHGLRPPRRPEGDGDARRSGVRHGHGAAHAPRHDRIGVLDRAEVGPCAWGQTDLTRPEFAGFSPSLR